MTHKRIDLPDGLRDLTYKFIKGVIDKFARENKLDALDGMTFYLLAQWFNVVLECSEKIDEQGITITTSRGALQLNPYCTERKTAQSHINTLLKELGLTLGSRGKIKAVSTMTEDSPLAQFIKSNK